MNVRVLPFLLVLFATSGCRRLTYGSFDLAACGGPHFSLLEALAPSVAYAELRDTRQPTDVKSVGVKCQGASSADECGSAVAASSSDRGWSNGSHGRMPGEFYVVATRGEQVLVINSVESMASALAPIDTPVKAAVIASVARNLSPSCTNSVRTAAGGFEVHLATDSCFGPRDEVVLVDAKGAVTIVKQWSGESTCVGAKERSQPVGALAER